MKTVKFFLKWSFILLIIMFLVVLITILVLQLSLIVNKNRCQKWGGVWVKDIIAGNTEYCSFPSKDIGKICHENSDCQRFCIRTSEHDPEGYFLGKCGDTPARDCAPVIPFKTKSEKDFKWEGCI